MSVWELYTQLSVRNWRCGSLSQGCSEKIRNKDVVMTAGRWSSWLIQIPQFLMPWYPAMKAGSTAMTHRPRDRVPSGSILGLPDPRKPGRAHPPTNFWWSFFYFDTGIIYMHWGPTGQTINKEYYVEVLREFRKRFRRKRPALFKSGQIISSRTMHQSTIDKDYLTEMGIKTVPQPPCSSDLAPCDFWLFPKRKEKLRGGRYETIEEMKEVWRRSLTRSHKRNSMGPSRSCWNSKRSALQPEEITSKGTRVSCVYYQ